MVDKVFLSKDLNYYIAGNRIDPGDSEIPYPTPGLVACIRGAPGETIHSMVVSTVLGSMGNGDPSNYPTQFQAAVDDAASSDHEPFSSTVVGDSHTTAATVLSTNAGTVLEKDQPAPPPATVAQTTIETLIANASPPEPQVVEKPVSSEPIVAQAPEPDPNKIPLQSDTETL